MIVIDDDDDETPVLPGNHPGLSAPSATPILHQTLQQPLIVAPVLPKAPPSICVTPITIPVMSQITVPTMSQLAITQSAPVNVLMSNGNVQQVFVVQNQGVNLISQESVASAVLDVAALGTGARGREMTLFQGTAHETFIDSDSDLHTYKRRRPNLAKQKEADSCDVPLCVVENVVGGFKSPPRKVKHNPVKQAVRSGDKVDWEDKIPMDVISFMVSVKLLYRFIR